MLRARISSQNTKIPHNNQKFFSVRSFYYRYEQDDGQIVSAAGGLKEVVGENGQPAVAQVITGAFTWVDAEGVIHWVNYTADENGFHPVVGTGAGGIGPGQDSSIDPNALKSLIG